MRLPFFLPILGLALSGCSSMSGYDAKTSFACKAPDGVLCESMSGIYANAEAKNLPGQKIRHDGASAAPTGTMADAAIGLLTKPITSGTPLRSAPLVLRVWFSPWEDADGDLHDQSYVYLPVNSGRWLIEHNRRRIADSYRPVRAPAAAATVTDGVQLPAASPAGARVVNAPPATSGPVGPMQNLFGPAPNGKDEQGNERDQP